MKVPPESPIFAPTLPKETEWINVAMLRMDKLVGKPVLVEFWDFCRPNSLRTLRYVREWHRRYADAGLQVIGIHSPGFPPSADSAAVRAAVERLAIDYPVAIDSDLEIWKLYGNQGWPARYLFNRTGRLVHYHYGEGAYRETEAEIQALLEVNSEPVAPLSPTDHPDAPLAPQTDDRIGAFTGPYAAGGVWGVLSGKGVVEVNLSHAVEVSHPGCFLLVDHQDVHTEGTLALAIKGAVSVHATCFTPGVLVPRPA